MNDGKKQPKRVVLRYEAKWSELQAQLEEDRSIGLTESAVRNGIVDWFDDDSFIEVGTLVRRGSSSYRGGDAEVEPEAVVPGDGLIAGWGEYAGSLVFVSADDVTLGGEIRGGAAAAKAARVRAHALEQSRPLLQIFAADRRDPNQFIGAEFVRFGFGVDLDFERLTDERILKIAIVSGTLDAQASLEASWCHLVVLCGPSGSLFGCNGDQALARGMADLVVDDLAQALAAVGPTLHHLPASAFAEPRQRDAKDTPGNFAAGAVLDDGWSWERTPRWCSSVQSRLGQIDGRTVGLLVAERAVELDAPTATKLVQAASFCRTFGCPLVIDHAGFDLPSAPTPADVHAVRRLGLELVAPDAVVIEVVRSDRRLLVDLGVRPLWTLEWPSATGDQSGPPPAARSALSEAVANLGPRRPAHADDERVRTRLPRTLQGG